MTVRRIKISVKPSARHNVGGFAQENIPKGTVFAPNVPRGFRGFNYDPNANAVPIGTIKAVMVRPKVIALRHIKRGEEIVYPPYDDGRYVTTYRQALDSHGFSNVKLKFI